MHSKSGDIPFHVDFYSILFGLDVGMIGENMGRYGCLSVLCWLRWVVICIGKVMCRGIERRVDKKCIVEWLCN